MQTHIETCDEVSTNREKPRWMSRLCVFVLPEGINMYYKMGTTAVVQNYLNGTEQWIHVRDALSNGVEITSSVPQESGPLRFPIYVDTVKGLKAYLNMFADDATKYGAFRITKIDRDLYKL